MFDKYSESIKRLNAFEKEDILVQDFLLFEDGDLKIYYAPHNEIINKDAKVFIVGITPGWTQTKIAYQTAFEGLKKGLSKEEIKKNCKRNSRFAGSMRKNLIEMLDDLKLNEKLGLVTCDYLFKENEELLHTTSMIPYPVFINGNNYTGYGPKVFDSDILKKYVRDYFYEEVRQVSNALIVPLGKSVEDVLSEMVKENLISQEQCLFGFPHPSGANGHRKRQFEENKQELKETIDSYFKEL